MEIIGGSSLGPVRVDLGRMRSADRPPLGMVLIGLVPVIGVVLIIIGIIFFVRMQLVGGRHQVGGTATTVLQWGIGGLAVIGGILVIAAFILHLLMVRAMTVTIHEGGLVIGRSWFRRLQAAWPEVAGFAPPEPGGAKSECWMLLRDGRRILIERLSLPSIRDHTGRLVPHADVRTVLDHFLAWQEAHGVR